MSSVFTEKVSVILPVLNERMNSEKLLSTFKTLVLSGDLVMVDELVFVDDGSTDGTVEFLRSKRSDVGNFPFKIEILARENRRGIVDASIEGARIARNAYVAVMDADLQHPPLILKEMYAAVHDGADIAVASRHVRGGQSRWSPLRGVISRCAIMLSYFLIKSSRKIKDRTSGYFLTRKEYVTNLEPIKGRAKILLYVLSKNTLLNVREVPYTFVERTSGSSKIVSKGFSFILSFLFELVGYMKLNGTGSMGSMRISHARYNILRRR